MVADEYFVCAVECSHAAGVDFVGVSDVDAVEVEAQQEADADGGAVHESSVEFVFLSFVHEPGVDVASPELQVGADHGVECELVLWLAEREVVASLRHDERVDGDFVCLVVAELDGWSEQVCGAKFRQSNPKKMKCFIQI